MKELRKDDIQPDTVEKHAEIPSERVHLATLKIKPGQRLWKFSMADRVISEVELVGGDVSLKGGVKYRIDYEEGYLYCTAINLKNARKKFIKRMRTFVSLAGKKYGE